MPLFSWMADETFEEMLGTVEGMELVELLGRVNQVGSKEYATTY